MRSGLISTSFREHLEVILMELLGEKLCTIVVMQKPKEKKKNPADFSFVLKQIYSE